ncbi:MAG: cytochrome d ubiquinol oxidase subunit II [Halioglobus sp.]|nr:cytochrome d ubiquinol oxidase subunit II [Halioglobus sp.]
MEQFLPVFFVMAMGLALLLYVILDGFDLGVGLLLPQATETEKDIMIASIGPFWDANETWIVLGIGILLIAFPMAQGIILTALYLPVTLMLFGLILRGVAFDFRVKAGDAHKQRWNRAFFLGSLIASMSQGWMLGAYITGLDASLTNTLFAALIALTLPALYVMLGAGWLLIKTEGELFDKAVRWARMALPAMGLALILVSIATPIVSAEIAARWFTLPNAIGLLPIPVSCLVAYFALYRLLVKPEYLRNSNNWVVYALLVLICLMAALGLAYSIYPDIIIGKMDLYEAAAATNSLQFIFWGVAVTLPVILAYSAYVFRVFRGKATNLSYE